MAKNRLNPKIIVEIKIQFNLGAFKLDVVKLLKWIAPIVITGFRGLADYFREGWP